MRCLPRHAAAAAWLCRGQGRGGGGRGAGQRGGAALWVVTVCARRPARSPPPPAHLHPHPATHCSPRLAVCQGAAQAAPFQHDFVGGTGGEAARGAGRPLQAAPLLQALQALHTRVASAWAGLMRMLRSQALRLAARQCTSRPAAGGGTPGRTSSPRALAPLPPRTYLTAAVAMPAAPAPAAAPQSARHPAGSPTSLPAACEEGGEGRDIWACGATPRRLPSPLPTHRLPHAPPLSAGLQ